MFVNTHGRRETDGLTPKSAFAEKESHFSRGLEHLGAFLPGRFLRLAIFDQLDPEEQTKLTFLHEVLSGKRTDVPRRRHHRLPVSVACRYRIANQSTFIDSAISEIGVGGALLTTPEPLPIDTELTVEVTPPGAAAPIAIAGRVSYHVPSGGSGLRFVSRDGDGDRRLRELIRRLRAS